MLTLLSLGIAIIIGTVIGLAVLLWFRNLGMGPIVGFGFVGLMAGVLVPILPSAERVVISVGGKSVELDQAINTVESKATQVKTDTDEVRALKDKIAKLADGVDRSEKNVEQMRDNVRQAYQALFEAVALTEYTKNLFPPPPFITQEISHELDMLALFAYPDPVERNAQVARVISMINQAQNPTRPTATPTH